MPTRQKYLTKLELLTVEQMAEADRLTIKGGLSGFKLMEAAGRAVFHKAKAMAPEHGRVLVACGPGNNGGDGFVVAQLLKESGYEVRLTLLGDIDQLTGDAARAAKSWTGDIEPFETSATAGYDLIIDALFGAGLSRPIDGKAARFITELNDSGCSVLSIDVPSGIDGNSGKVRGIAVRATNTVTFFRAKPGHLLLPGRRHCGQLKISFIGIQPDVLNDIAPNQWRNGRVLWRHAMATLKADNHKYSRGHALVISGGITSSGAARLAARGALRAGAGLVTMASPKSALMVNAVHLNAIMLTPFEGADSLAEILRDKRKNAVLIGPGCGVGEATRDNVFAALKSEAAVILDADALTSFEECPDELFQAIKNQPERPVCMTPHDGEFSRVFAKLDEGDDIPITSKLARARSAARLSGATIILKGADSVIAAPDGRAAINDNAPPTLATAGSGDVLAGFLTGLVAQQMPSFEAACAAVWLHGAAANLFDQRHVSSGISSRISSGQSPRISSDQSHMTSPRHSGLIAEDLTEILPAVLQKLDE